MMSKKRKGAQKGNKNAQKFVENYKHYYPIRFFGQRWEYEIGQAIDVYLQSFESQREWLEEFLLPNLPEISPVDPNSRVEMQLKVSREAFEFLQASGLEPECLERVIVEEAE